MLRIGGWDRRDRRGSFPVRLPKTSRGTRGRVLSSTRKGTQSSVPSRRRPVGPVAAVITLLGMILIACSTDERLLTPEEWAVIAADSHDTVDSDACPSGANSCENATWEDRERMLDDLDFLLDWDNPDCVVVRDHLKERFFYDPVFIIAKFDDFNGDGKPYGEWAKWYENERWQRAISFNRSYLTGGTRSGLGWQEHRAKTAIHEGHHDKYESTQDEAYAFEELCIHA